MKFISLNNLIKKLKTQKYKKKIIFTNGCFDILHPGHIYFLKKAKKLGDVLIVAVNSDSSIKKIKGKNRPIINFKNRVGLLNELKFVNFIVKLNDLEPTNLIRKIKPSIHCKGIEYKNVNIKEKKIVKELNIKMKFIKKYKNYSTTNLVKKNVK
jgi:cytidyltransferase-like protein